MKVAVRIAVIPLMILALSGCTPGDPELFGKSVDNITLSSVVTDSQGIHYRGIHTFEDAQSLTTIAKSIRDIAKGRVSETEPEVYNYDLYVQFRDGSSRNLLLWLAKPGQSDWFMDESDKGSTYVLSPSASSQLFGILNPYIIL